MKHVRIIAAAAIAFCAVAVTASAGDEWHRSVSVGKFPQRMIDKYDKVAVVAGEKINSAAVCEGWTYFATGKELVTFDGKIWAEFGGKLPAFSSGVNVVACGAAGEVLAGTPGGLYSIKGGKASKLAGGNVKAVAAAGKSIYVATDKGLSVVTGGKASAVKELSGKAVTSVAVGKNGTVWAGTANGLAKVEGAKVTMITKAADGSAGLLNDDVRALYVDGDGVLWIGTAAGLSKVDAAGKWDYLTGEHGGMPYEDVTAISGGKGYVWVGTTFGAERFDGKEWHYYQGPQYLASDNVTAIAALPEGAALIGTDKGASKAWYQMMTLEDKAKFFEDMTRKLNNRYGLFSDASLKVPGDYSTNVMFTNDNDGLWTAMYVAAECYRYGATGDPEAKKFARESMEAIMKLEQVTEIPGFMARSFAKPEDPHCDGEWDHITSDGKWRWKGDTSSDEVVGHYYAYSVYYDLCADDAEKAEISKVVDRITSYIVDNGYLLLDKDGKPTTFGHWSPAHFKGEGRFQRGLNSLEILSHLITAYHITGNEKYEQEYRNLVLNEKYAKFTIEQKLNQPYIINHSDDELAFLSYQPLFNYEFRRFALDSYEKSMERSWKIDRPEKNPLWNMIRGAALPGDFDIDNAVWTLQRIPLTMLRWGHTNSKRADITLDTHKGRFSEAQSIIPVPPDERTITLWNANPFSLDSGGNGTHEQPGTFYLLPYWMGRYYGYIVEGE